MEEAIEKFKAAIPFKETTDVGDLVLMVNEPLEEDESLQAAYAKVVDFVRDESKRDEWWYVHLVFLAVPPQPTVLILQKHHFTGQEVFTIGGKKVFIKAVDVERISEVARQDKPEEESQTSKESKPKEKKPKSKAGLKVVK
jgi:hypothetical protein